MNPGDLYNPDPNAPDPRDPYSASRLPPSQSYPAQLPHSARQPTFPPPNPYDNLAPAGQRPFPSSQSTPFPQFQGGSQPPYGDPFHDNAGPVGPPPVGQWENTPGSRHHASYPVLPVSPPPQIQGNLHGPRQSLPPSQSQPLAMSPPRMQNLAPPDMNSPRTRFDSNVSYHSANSVPPSQSQPYGLMDNRLASPPPLLPQHSSSSSIGYPPRQVPFPHSNSQQYGLQDDETDSAPLLNHASADPRFGVPMNNGAASPARFQLQDGGDVGVMPNRWRHDSGWDNSSQNGSSNGQPFGYGLSGGNEPPGQDESNVRYGPLPTRILRRNRTQKKVK